MKKVKHKFTGTFTNENNRQYKLEVFADTFYNTFFLLKVKEMKFNIKGSLTLIENELDGFKEVNSTSKINIFKP